MRPVVRALALSLLALWSCAPMLWQLVTSIKPAAELTRLPPLLPASPTLEHYAAVLAEPSFLRVIANSFAVAAGSTAIAVGLGSLAAFALAKLRPRGAGLLLAAAVALSMMPPIATVTPLFLAINALGLRDTIAALVLTYAGFCLPLAIWVLTQSFRALPDELYFAARVDGCSAGRAFLAVMLPLAAPGLAAASMLVFVFAWNEFLFALTFTATTASRTVPVAIALFPGLHEIPWGEIAAASLVVTLPLLVLAGVFQRRILEGLTAGAVKG